MWLRRSQPWLAALVGLSLLLPYPALRWMALSLGGAHLLLWFRGMFHPRSRLLGPVTWRIPTEEPVVYLTFDDGPTPGTTERILDILQAVGARATFFPVGERLARHPLLGRRMVSEGHRLGAHTTTHPKLLSLKSRRRVRSEIRQGADLVERFAGRRPTWFRPPALVRSPIILDEAREAGLEMVSWTVRGLEGWCSSPDRLRRRMGAKLRPGAILLLHDGPGTCRADLVAAALPEILGAALRQGYRVEPLPEPGLDPNQPIP